MTPHRAAVRPLAVAAGVGSLAAALPSLGPARLGLGSTVQTVAGLAAAVTMAALIWLAPARSPRWRAGWRLLAAGAVLVAAGGVWFHASYADRAEAVPSPPDAVFVAGYACLVGGVLLLFRRPGDEAPRSAALDGVLLGLAAATVAESSFLDALVGPATGGFAGQAVSRSYLVLDLCLVGTVLARAASDLWRSRRWQLLALAGSSLAVADLGYLHRVAAEDLSGPAWYHPLYLLAGLALTGAAWSRPASARHRRVESARMVVLPGGVAAVAAGVLVWDHFDPRSDLAVGLAALALAGVALRAGLTLQYLGQLVDARRLAVTDDLTGLPNRRWFLDELRAATDAAPPRPFVLLLVGVDRLRDLNDTLGHHVGDQVLRDSAARLVAALRPCDRVARLGGDEFAVLAPGDEATGARAVAALRAAFTAPVPVADLTLSVDVSIGGAVHPHDGDRGGALLRRADVALHEAKRSDERWAMYRPDRDRTSLQRLSLAADLRGAVAGGGLSVVYQPIADARTRGFCGAEALVRWEHPRHGLLMPAQFLDIAQQTGAMRGLTRLVLEAALAQCQQWRGEGLDLTVCVNLPPSALLDLGLPAMVGEALDRTSVPPGRLTLELTENGLLEDPNTALGVLRALRDLGVRLAVDDYGTGYASLSYLRDLPVHSLKIDRSFAVGIAGDTAGPLSRNGALVRSTIVLAHELRFDVVAEGVEDAGTLACLERWGIDAVQGYLVGRPMAGAAIGESLRRWGRVRPRPGVR